MNRFLNLLLIAAMTFGLGACDTDDDGASPQQQIVTSDTSELTGELTVFVEKSGRQRVGSGVNVRLYATAEDMDQELFLYDLFTGGSGQAYFGFINYGNYYIKASGFIDGQQQVGYGAIQIRPRRDERVIITVRP